MAKETCSELSEKAADVGLKINTGKTKVMVVNWLEYRKL